MCNYCLCLVLWIFQACQPRWNDALGAGGVATWRCWWSASSGFCRTTTRLFCWDKVWTQKWAVFKTLVGWWLSGILWNYTTQYTGDCWWLNGIILPFTSRELSYFQSMDSMHPTPMLLFHFLLHFLHLRSAGQKRRGLYFFSPAAKGSGIAAAVFVAGAEGSARTASDICCVVDVPVAQQLTKSDDVTTRFLWHPANFEPLSVWKSSRAMNLVFISPKKLNHQWSILVFQAFNEHSIVKSIGWLVVWNSWIMFPYFSISYMGCHPPHCFSIFFRGVGQPPTSIYQ